MHPSKMKTVYKLFVSNINCKSYISTFNNNTAKSITESSQQIKSWEEIPGPTRSSIIFGNMYNVLKGSKFSNGGFEVLEAVYNQYGPIVKIPGLFKAPNLIILYDAESIAHVLRSENWLPKRPGVQSLEYYRKVYRKNNDIANTVTELTTDNGGFEVLEAVYNQYGPIVKIPGLFKAPNLIILYDAESIAHVLRSENWLPKRPGVQSLEYYRKVYRKNNDIANTVTGLTTDHGEQWKKLRSMVNPVLLQPKTIKLYSTILDEVARDMIKRMKSNRDENNMIKGDLSEEMNLWALESISVVALGGRLNCFDPNLPPDSPVRKLIHIVHDFFVVADKLDFKPSLWRLYSTRTFRKAMKLYEEQENLNKKFIKIAMEKLKTEATVKSEKEKGILEKLLEMDEHVAILMASDLLFAGVDTAAHTIIPIFYLLAKNPEKQNKLREEVLSSTEKRPYLKACIKEAMRIMPVVSGNIRETSKEYNLLGYKIPKYTYLTFAHQYTSMMECHYPRPREYIPERWITSKDDPLYHGNAHPFAFSPFGFGARSCIGRRIAELEIETFLARVIQNFHIEWFGEPLRQYQSALNYVRGPYNFIFRDI